ncbi:hypothetical protein [Swingsia samuiensis]|uniref:hypothetical protein n=1 Tax=Swingsia samuiensis TaxID=1293412 RepID=UPI0015E89132|nr:hypothetical protein [Swingsia samuiensis]
MASRTGFDPVLPLRKGELKSLLGLKRLKAVQIVSLNFNTRNNTGARSIKNEFVSENIGMFYYVIND